MSKENDFAAQFSILTRWADQNKEAEEVIEGLLAALSDFDSIRDNQYKEHCLPAIEKAQKFLGK